VISLGLNSITVSPAAATASANLGGLFTVASLVSLQGAAAACLLVPNVLGVLIGPQFSPRLRNWTAFVLAEGLAYLTAVIVNNGSWLHWVIACFNGFLIFSSAFGLDAAGAQITGASERRPEAVMRGYSISERRFFVPWTF
jgi:hypothetical protein